MMVFFKQMEPDANFRCFHTMPFHIFEDFQAPDIEDFQSLKGKGGHFEKGLFIAEGEKIARKILESSFEVPSAYLTAEHFERLRPLFEKRTDSTNVFRASKETMANVIGYHLHQGIMLAVKIPKSRGVMEAISKWESPWLAVALDGIADAENMGGIIRNAAAFGAKAVIVDETSCNPWLRRSVRVSMGTIVDVEIIWVQNLALELAGIPQIKPIRIIGAALSPNSVELSTIKPDGNTMLVFGSEGWGLRKEVLAGCDTLAEIPMAEGVDSLNVAVASGIFLYAFQQVVRV